MIAASSVKLDQSHPVGSVIGKALSITPSESYLQSLIEPFRSKSDSADLGWRGEFWGKWALGIIDSIPFSPTRETMQLLRQSVSEIVSTQEPNGYIGTYLQADRSTGFDIWNIKYTLWALACYAHRFDDSSVRDSVSRLIDYLCSLLPDLGDQGLLGKSIEQLQGAGIASLLDPLHFIFTELRLPRAEQISEQILGELSGEIRTSAGLGGFLEPEWDDKPPKLWPGAKAYELMATIDGVLKWAVSYSDDNLVKRMVSRVRKIYEFEIMVTGSGSSFELFSSGSMRQAADVLRPQETCVSVYWMRLCETAWRITADPFFLDQLAQSLHNALLASVSADATWWSYFCPLKGASESSHLQFSEIQTSCCVSNGPRGLFSISRWAINLGADGLNVNCLIPGRYGFEVSGTEQAAIEIISKQVKDYKIQVRAEVAGISQTVFLLPSWSEEHESEAGRELKFTENFEFSLSCQPRIINDRYRSDVIAVSFGPYVYALDGKSIPEAPKYLWLFDTAIGGIKYLAEVDTLTIEFENRPSHYFNFSKHTLELRPYFALARESRELHNSNRYLVWIPQPLVVGRFDTFGELSSHLQQVANLSQD